MDLTVTPQVPFNIVGVRFVSINTDAVKVYHYRTRIDFAAGDSAVVEVNGILKVVEIAEAPATTDYTGELKWIVCKVDTTEYINRLKEEVAIEKELRAIEKLAKERVKVKAV